MTDPTPQEASEEAVHKAQEAQQAVEIARETHMQDAISKTAEQTKEAVMAGFKEVFGKGDGKDEEMVVLYSRIPILCTTVNKMHEDIGTLSTAVAVMSASNKKIIDNTTWGVRIVIGAVILALLKLVLIP